MINPNSATLAEVISAAPLEGQWWFWWSWAEPITPVGDIATTAERIRRVLATAAPARALPSGVTVPMT
ncbi:hypothetical protein ACWENQ_33410 [Nonomuraea sp. NPDC004354]